METPILITSILLSLLSGIQALPQSGQTSDLYTYLHSHESGPLAQANLACCPGLVQQGTEAQLAQQVPKVQQCINTPAYKTCATQAGQQQGQTSSTQQTGGSINLLTYIQQHPEKGVPGNVDLDCCAHDIKQQGTQQEIDQSVNAVKYCIAQPAYQTCLNDHQQSPSGSSASNPPSTSQVELITYLNQHPELGAANADLTCCDPTIKKVGTQQEIQAAAGQVQQCKLRAPQPLFATHDVADEKPKQVSKVSHTSNASLIMVGLRKRRLSSLLRIFWVCFVWRYSFGSASSLG